MKPKTVSRRKNLRFEAPAVVQSWKRFLICSCSHGELIDPTAETAILKFRAEYKPEIVAHLGDACDTQAWRAGAKGSSDETHSVSDDIEKGLNFLARLRPTIFFNGNHEFRIWKAVQSPNAIVCHAASLTVQRFREFMEDIKCTYVESYDWQSSWAWLNDNTLLGHGIAFSQNAVRDHAVKMGRNVFIGHLHNHDHNTALMHGGPWCACVGYLGQADKFHYADTWPSKMRWQTGWIYGEKTDTQIKWQQHRHEAPRIQAKDFLRV